MRDICVHHPVVDLQGYRRLSFFKYPGELCHGLPDLGFVERNFGITVSVVGSSFRML